MWLISSWTCNDEEQSTTTENINPTTAGTDGSIGWCTTCSTSTRDPVYMYHGCDILVGQSFRTPWLSATKHLIRFARIRVEEIIRLTCRLPWRYWPTDENPADLHIRGVSANVCLGNQLWNAGSAWLSNSDQWPTWEYNQSTVQMLPEDADDTHRQTTVVSSLQCTEIPGIQRVRVVDETNYSTYLRLLRVTAYMCRIAHNCRRQRANRVTSSLTANELHDAEIRWLKSC